MPKETRKPNAEWRRELADVPREDPAFWTWGEEPGADPMTRTLWREAKELNLIFGAIWRKR
jgi:hypothetical protein